MTRAGRDKEVAAVTDAMRHYAAEPHIATDYDNYYRNTDLLRYDTVVLDRAFERPGRLLDLGCGPGRHLVHFAEKGFEVTGLDLSPHMVELARENLKDANLRGRVIRGDICDLSDFEDGAFDYCIAMFSVVGMVRGSENRLGILRQVRRILAPGGLFAFHVHNRLYHAFYPGWIAWLARTYLVDRFIGREVGDRTVPVYRGIPNMYIHVFTEAEARDMIAGAGLEPVHIEYLNPRRTGPLPSPFARKWRANGFVFVARAAAPIPTRS